jgi:hypothetical protein
VPGAWILIRIFRESRMQADDGSDLDRKSGYPGDNDLFFAFSEGCNRNYKFTEGASPRLFRPTYAEANVGHPPLFMVVRRRRRPRPTASGSIVRPRLQ